MYAVGSVSLYSRFTAVTVKLVVAMVGQYAWFLQDRDRGFPLYANIKFMTATWTMSKGISRAHEAG